MLGYMNEEAYRKTVEEKKVTFYSRSKQRLWTKGEATGNYLYVNKLDMDCDKDTLLIRATPKGPTCHTGSTNCFGTESSKGFLYQLEGIINEKISTNSNTSYTNKIYSQGINKIAQKVGEEAIELVIESKDDNEYLFKEEASDLLYHFLILLKAKSIRLEDIEKILCNRNK